MSFKFWLLYCSTVFIVSIIPGPSMILALTHGMQFGLKKATISTLGVTISTVIQASISIAGLGAILLASEVFFIIVKVSGAIYLTYIGIMLIISSGSHYTEFSQKILKPSNMQLLHQGVMVSIFNPKAIIFFTALFPQFINTETNSAASYTILFSSLVIIQISCSLIYAIAGKKVIRIFKASGQFFNKAIGIFFVVSGLALLLNGIFSQPSTSNID
ncbi:MAG: LysE family translocator [Denitrovibrio sp.]|nr:MAG: LysE family translocator [Denitrovibrio sp.]